MNITGLVAEYNPFHNGHKYHIEKARALSGASHVAAVISGSFVQRGDVAVCDKWARAKMAIAGGVDLVVELPVVYSCQSAEYFAKGAVEILRQIGCTHMSFGAETDDLQSFTEVADILKNPTDEYKKHFSDSMKKGMSYPAAQAVALKKMGYPAVLDTPNNTLAVEYLKAKPSDIIPIAIKRHGSQHDGIGSASFVRRLIASGEDISAYVPQSTVDILNEAASNGVAPCFVASLDIAVLARLRTMSPKQLERICDVSEGLENRIIKAAQSSTSFAELADKIKTKRYTHSRIRRILLNALLGTTKGMEHLPPQYIRVLAMNDGGREILKAAKKTAQIPIITKAADAKENDMLTLDFASTDIFSLTFPAQERRTGMYDMKTSPNHLKTNG